MRLCKRRLHFVPDDRSECPVCREIRKARYEKQCVKKKQAVDRDAQLRAMNDNNPLVIEMRKMLAERRKAA